MVFFARRRRIGQQGERHARRFLRRRGWRIVTKNLRIGKDEVDILAVSPKGETLAMVEVRSTADSQGDPRRTVGHKKRRCMTRSARQVLFLARKHRCQLRVDLIEVNLGHQPPTIVHHEGVLPINNEIK
ncbi:MAG: YraN family protein [Phycisphaerales bacterium]|nr:YraN family protein [Phycisphaerales bacterium]